VIPALAAIEVEPPRSRPGVENHADRLGIANRPDAVDLVETRVIADFNATAINGTRFVDLAIAAAARRAELGAPPTINPAAAALAAILARASGTKRSVDDVGRIHALIHHHAAAGTLPMPEAAELLEQCKAVYQAVATHSEAPARAAA
jgi:hypothetical protein